jgi:hypothetical protein
VGKDFVEIVGFKEIFEIFILKEKPKTLSEKSFVAG